MNEPSIVIRKPYLLIFTGALVFLITMLLWLNAQRKSFQAQNRYLILKNDSIMSVNILLTDSLKQKSSGSTKGRTASLK